jgi:hypothetical protein
MQESTKQYQRRILNYIKNRDAFSIMQLSPKRLKKLTAKVPRKATLRAPAPGKWSVAEIVNHLAEGEIVFAYRLRMILGKNGTPIQAYNQVAWARNAKMVKQDLRTSLELFRVLRENNIRLLKAIPKKMWDYHGMHQERGRETVARMVQLYAGHDVNHLVQIEKILGC